jgi:hypothetical protein
MSAHSVKKGGTDFSRCYSEFMVFELLNQVDPTD